MGLTMKITAISLLLLILLTAGLFPGLVQAQPQKVHKIVIKAGSFQFTPDALTIQTGDTVQWINEDTKEIHFLIDNFFSRPGAQPEIGSRNLDPGKMTQHTFMHPGEFPYQCFIHFQQHNMKGTVIVEGEDLDPLPF